MPDETSRHYLFLAIDRATRWVSIHIYGVMVELFNGRINELLQQTHFDSMAVLATTLLKHLMLYNQHIP